MKLDRCWFFPKDPPIFILGGRFGDIIELSGCLHAIWQRTRLKPIMFTSRSYVSIYDGMSYVRYHEMKGDWYGCIPAARVLAEKLYGGGTVVQFWNDDPKYADTIGFTGKNIAIIQSHGHNWGVNCDLDPDYGTSMARRMGFNRQEWLSLAPVFDLRNREREATLVKHHRNSKPMLLYNFTGVTAPFPYVPEMMRLLHPFRRDFNMVDVGAIHCHRLYDLLGLYDQAAGLLTGDTSTAHLARASRVPTLWFTRNGWGGSVPSRCE